MQRDLPDLVDLQVNGFLGVDFSDPVLEPEDARRAARTVLERGAAAFLPTMITSAEDVYARNLPLLADLCEDEEFAGRLPGIHAEGPFLNPAPGLAGAHNPEWVRPPDADVLGRMQEHARGHIRLLTLAADRPGAPEVTAAAREMGIAVSLGHHDADPNDLARCAEAGAAALTHLGNGVPLSLHRHDNPIWAGLAETRLAAMLVTDGHHLPAHVLAPVLRALGPDRVIAVSDAAGVAGLPPGKYNCMGNPAVLTPEGRLHNPETGFLVGSASHIRQCAEHLASLGVLDGVGIEKACLHNPLRLLGMTTDDLEPEPR
jgi:N-acetylglucosamine-6-phosphate deacetylase